MVPRVVGSNPITHPRILLSKNRIESPSPPNPSIVEDKNLIEISVKYGLNSEQLSKLVDVLYQAGLKNSDSPEFTAVSKYICETNLLDMPIEDLLEELKRKNLIEE